MSTRASEPRAARRPLRETLFAAARGELESRPWAQITMTEVANAAGVSRQTLYKAFGSRNEFAQAFVVEEGERFLDEVEASVRDCLDDPRAAVRAALETFLRSAAEDPLVRMLTSDDGTGGMLPFVTTQGLPILHWTAARLAAVMADGWPGTPADRAHLLAETLVRLAISYVTTPVDPPDVTAARTVELLGPFIDETLR